MKNEVLLSEFVQSIINVSEKGATIARLIRSESTLLNLLIQEKKRAKKNEQFVKDFKTLADVLIQEMVKHDLCREFTGLQGHIYGEESTKFTNVLSETISVEIKDTQLNTCQLLEQILDGNHDAAELLSATAHQQLTLPMSHDLQQIREHIDVSTLALWIDPIDGTGQYIKGDYGTVVHEGLVTGGLENVLVLIGVFDRRTGTPIIGVINQPFATFKTKRWEGRCLWGIRTTNVQSFCMGIPSTNLTPDVPHFPTEASMCATTRHKPLVLISDVDAVLRDILATEFDLMTVTSAGYKLMATAIGLSDAYVVTKATTFKWDTCAPHAILRACGGGIVDLHAFLGKAGCDSQVSEDARNTVQLRYDVSDGMNVCNAGGILAYRDPHVLHRIVALLAQSRVSCDS